MQFSLVLALLPLALASPIDPRTSQPCCNDCDTSLFMKCMNACPDHPFFTVCKFDCTRTRLTCLANCKACDGTIIIPHLGAPVVKPGPKARSENEADFFTGYIPYPHSHSHESEQQEQQEQEQEQEQEEEKPKGLQAAEDAATIYNRFN